MRKPKYMTHLSRFFVLRTQTQAVSTEALHFKKAHLQVNFKLERQWVWREIPNSKIKLPVLVYGIGSAWSVWTFTMGPTSRRRSQTWELIPHSSCLAILNNFTFEFAVCSWSLMKQWSMFALGTCIFASLIYCLPPPSHLLASPEWVLCTHPHPATAAILSPWCGGEGVREWVKAHPPTQLQTAGTPCTFKSLLHSPHESPHVRRSLTSNRKLKTSLCLERRTVEERKNPYPDFFCY